jgi:hypothetical protein
MGVKLENLLSVHSLLDLPARDLLMGVTHLLPCHAP